MASTKTAAPVELEAIKTEGTQVRVGMDQHVVNDYAAAMKAGEVFPPVVVFFDGADYWAADGHHRVAAARGNGLKQIDADVRTGGKRDALLFAVGANAAHGLPRTNADKRKAVGVLLADKQWAKRSDRWVAERCSVGHAFVSNLRAQLSTVDSSRVGRDGKNRRPKVKSAVRVRPAAVEQGDREPAPPGVDAPSAHDIAASILAQANGLHMRYVLSVAASSALRALTSSAKQLEIKTRLTGRYAVPGGPDEAPVPSGSLRRTTAIQTVPIPPRASPRASETHTTTEAPTRSRAPRISPSPAGGSGLAPLMSDGFVPRKELSPSYWLEPDCNERCKKADLGVQRRLRQAPSDKRLQGMALVIGLLKGRLTVEQVIANLEAPCGG